MISFYPYPYEAKFLLFSSFKNKEVTLFIVEHTNCHNGVITRVVVSVHTGVKMCVSFLCIGQVTNLLKGRGDQNS